MVWKRPRALSSKPVQGTGPRNGCLSLRHPLTLNAPSDGLTSELVLLNTELKGNVQESSGLCFAAENTTARTRSAT